MNAIHVLPLPPPLSLSMRGTIYRRCTARIKATAAVTMAEELSKPNRLHCYRLQFCCSVSVFFFEGVWVYNRQPFSANCVCFHVSIKYWRDSSNNNNKRHIRVVRARIHYWWSDRKIYAGCSASVVIYMRHRLVVDEHVLLFCEEINISNFSLSSTHTRVFIYLD